MRARPIAWCHYSTSTLTLTLTLTLPLTPTPTLTLTLTLTLTSGPHQVLLLNFWHPQLPAASRRISLDSGGYEPT